MSEKTVRQEIQAIVEREDAREKENLEKHAFLQAEIERNRKGEKKIVAAAVLAGIALAWWWRRRTNI